MCVFFAGDACRAHAPKSQLIPARNGVSHVGLWPPVAASGWCGEWQVRY